MWVAENSTYRTAVSETKSIMENPQNLLLGRFKGVKGVTKNSDIGNVVIGKMDDLGKASGWKAGETLLYIGKKYSWKKNKKLLNAAMKQGKPIRDASPRKKDDGMLKKERDYLKSKGWVFQGKTKYWNPPTKN